MYINQRHTIRVDNSFKRDLKKAKRGANANIFSFLGDVLLIANISIGNFTSWQQTCRLVGGKEQNLY